ncbi:MAG TPA: SpoIIE family protein phosphatase [Blastocatellia bacterium]|nr:SpoIIE family protein phosphatase [Blastocatellia bacterium]
MDDSSASPKWLEEPTSRPDRKDPYLRFHAIKIFVRDQDRSLKFYVEQLGFSLVYDTHLQSGERWVAVAPPDGTAILALVEPNPASREYKLIGRATQVAFVTDNVLAKYHEWSQRGVKFSRVPRLKRIKYEPPPTMTTSGGQAAAPAQQSMLLGERSPVWGGVFTRFEDIDGNSFSLVSFDEVSQALDEQRRATAEKLELERRAEQELGIAKQVQARLFPQTLPVISTLDYAGVCIQARAVGGDYYDFLDLGGQRLGIVIGDIAGKGIAAALLMANLQANLRSQCAIALDQPEQFLRSVNQLFFENTTDGAYATLFFGEYDDRAGRLRYANCGHLCALLLRSDDSVERLDSTSTVLGLFKEWDCSISERQLLAGDTVALYTDGITESFNDAEEEYGEQRLTEALRQHRDLTSQEMLGAIVDDVQKFSPREQHDDITLIVAKVRGN